QGYLRVRQIRAAVRRAKAPVEVKHAYGIGRRDHTRTVRDVKAAMQGILDRVKNRPDEAESFGILQKDVDALELELAAITSADSTQEEKRAHAPLATQERNRTANRILAAVARIEGAGRMEFAGDEAIRPSFEALGPKKPAKRKNVAETGAE